MRLQIIKRDFKYYHYYELQNFHHQVLSIRFGFLMSPFSPRLKINEVNMCIHNFLQHRALSFEVNFKYNKSKKLY